MKGVIGNLVAFVATMLITGVFAIPMATTLAVMICFILVEHLAFVVTKHIMEKAWPSIIQWIQYAFEVATLVLIVCGINYLSMYTLIAGVLTGVISIIIALTQVGKDKKKPEEVEGESAEESVEEAETEEVESAEVQEEAASEN